MASESDRAAESNSLQPSVPASAASRDIRSLAPGWEGGSPSSLTTVASTTSSPRASRRASSSSTLGTRRGPREDRAQDRDGAGNRLLGGRIARRQTKASQRLLQAQAHRQQHV